MTSEVAPFPPSLLLAVGDWLLAVSFWLLATGIQDLGPNP
jgi:hypothetical protein